MPPRSASATTARSRARRSRARRGGCRARADRGFGRPRPDLRAPLLRDQHGRPRARRARRAARREGRGARDAAAVLRARVGRARDDVAERSSQTLRSTTGATALGAAQVPAVPPLGARGADRHREDRLRRLGVVAALRGAARRSPRRARRASVSLETAMSRLYSPDRDDPGGRRRGDHRAPCRRRSGRAPSSSTRSCSTSRSTTGCAATRPGSRHATSRTRRPTRRSTRSSRRRPRATTSPQRYYRLKARLLGLDRLDHYDRSRRSPTTREVRGTTRGGRRRCLSEFSDEAGAIVARFFDDNWIDGARPTRQAHRRVSARRRSPACTPTCS